MAPPDKLLAAVTFQRWCGEEFHTIRLATYEYQGKSGLSGATLYTDYLNVVEIDPNAHDIELELGLAELGAPKPYCLQLLEAWDRNHKQQAIQLFSFATGGREDLVKENFDLANHIVLAWGEAVYPIYEAKKGTTTYSAAMAFNEAIKFVEGYSQLDTIRWHLSQHFQGKESDRRSAGYEEGFPYAPGPSQYAENVLLYAAEFVSRPAVGQSMQIFLDVLSATGLAARTDAMQTAYAPPLTLEAQIAHQDSAHSMWGEIAGDLFIRRMISIAIRTFAEWPGWEPWMDTTTEVGRSLKDD